MPELRTGGYEGWWPVKEFLGKTRDGQTKIYRESFRNMENGQVFHDAQKGWDGEPPYPTGDIAHIRPSDAFRANYDLINWEK